LVAIVDMTSILILGRHTATGQKGYRRRWMFW
jgi:hypothetical protein